VSRVQRIMREKKLYIADGHHRYETALTYCREQAAAGVQAKGDEAIDRAMMALVSIHDEGLSVLPTHRVLFSLPEFSLPGLLDSLAEDFEVREAGEAREENLLSRLDEMRGCSHNFLLAAKGEQTLFALRLKPNVNPAKQIAGEGSEVWKSLDVTMLHSLILEQRLKISPQDLEHQAHVAYFRDPAEALGMVLELKSKFQAAFFLNPTRVEEVVEVADCGECMPQKSTDFFPKMLTGLVINKLNLK